MNVTAPYKWSGMWVFDDERVCGVITNSARIWPVDVK
jgi:hypothetical protein